MPAVEVPLKSASVRSAFGLLKITGPKSACTQIERKRSAIKQLAGYFPLYGFNLCARVSTVTYGGFRSKSGHHDWPVKSVTRAPSRRRVGHCPFQTAIFGCKDSCEIFKKA